VLLGDVMQVRASGGLFVVQDVDAEQLRFAARKTVVTGPMFGPKMKPTNGEPAIREQRVLDAARLTPDAFRRFGHLTDGTRRPMLVWPDDLQVSAIPDGVLFEFSLPSGAYATMLLREFMKSDDSVTED
jgi:tRNA pseudouridine13 synthase